MPHCMCHVFCQLLTVARALDGRSGSSHQLLLLLLHATSRYHGGILKASRSHGNWQIRLLHLLHSSFILPTSLTLYIHICEPLIVNID